MRCSKWLLAAGLLTFSTIPVPVVDATAAVLPASSGGQAATHDSQKDSAEDLDALAELAFDLLNQSRIEAGLDSLALDPALSLLAFHHSREQANRDVVSHHSYEFGLSTERRLRISFPTAPRLAENVARNRTIGRLHQALLDSEGHRRNRLDPEFTHVGVGVARAGPYSLYLTEVFASAPPGGELGEPMAYYFDAPPGSYEQRDDPRVEQGPTTITVGPPGDDDPEFWTHRGLDAYDRGELAAAIADFRHALALKPDYFYAEYNLARALITSGEAATAAALLDGLLERRPEDLDMVATRGSAALLLQDYAGAERYFLRVLESRPDDGASWYNLGLALEYQSRLSEAEAAYRRALDLQPDLKAAQIGLGRVIRR